MLAIKKVSVHCFLCLRFSQMYLIRHFSQRLNWQSCTNLDGTCQLSCEFCKGSSLRSSNSFPSPLLFFSSGFCFAHFVTSLKWTCSSAVGLKLVDSGFGAKAWDSYPCEMWLKDLCRFPCVLSELLGNCLIFWNRLEATVDSLMLNFL